MSLLPGVPNMGPKPVMPSISPGIHGNTGAAGKTFAHADPKGARAQSLGSPYTGPRATVDRGDPLTRMMGHYGKTPPAGMAGMAGSAPPIDPTAHAGSKMVRGSGGGMRPHIRQGGLGPKPVNSMGGTGTMGDSSDYSMTDTDPE